MWVEASFSCHAWTINSIGFLCAFIKFVQRLLIPGLHPIQNKSEASLAHDIVVFLIKCVKSHIATIAHFLVITRFDKKFAKPLEFWTDKKRTRIIKNLLYTVFVHHMFYLFKQSFWRKTSIRPNGI